MGNRLYYTFHVYDNNDNYKWDVVWVAPKHYTPSGSYYDQSGVTANITTGEKETFGGFVSCFYINDPNVTPDPSYGYDNVFDNLGFSAVGVDITPYIGTVTKWYLDRANQVYIRVNVQNTTTPGDRFHHVSIYLTYYRGSSNYGSANLYCEKTYKNQSGWGYLGILYAPGLLLPDKFPADENHGATHTIIDGYMKWNPNDRVWENGRVIVQGFSDQISVANMEAWMDGYTPEEPDDDNPYDELVDNDNHGGSNTNFSDDSDTVTEDSLPTISAVGTGFATLFSPSRGQLRALSEIFWNSNFFTAMQNLVENITNMFTSLAMVPFTVPTSGTVEVTWLGMAITEVYLTLAAQQYLEFNMGTIDLSGDNRVFTYDNALDYSPFSRLGIYLPFIGYQELDIDECRGSTINLKYRVDIMSGSCVAIVKVNGNAIYQFTGNCLTQIPITNESIQSLITDAVNVGIAAANARTVGAASSADIAASEGSDKMSEAQKKAHEAHARVSQTNADTHLQSATANAIMGLKPQYNKTGSVSAAAAMMSVRQPYLFLTTSRMAIPKYYEHYAGFPCNMTGKLNEFEGFTVVDSIRLNELVATTPEVEEIYEILKKGVII